MVDIKVIVEVVVKYNVVLELNNLLFIYLCKGSEMNCCVIVEVVRDVGGWLVLGLDFYIVYLLGIFEYCECIIVEVNFL